MDEKYIEERKRNEALRKAGVSGTQISRRILEMVGELHKRGYESLYIDPTMAPSGCYWRYEIGAMNQGAWPCRSPKFKGKKRTVIVGSIGGGYDQVIPWGKPDDSLEQFVEGFCRTYPTLLKTAAEPNAQYVKWYQDMLEATHPEGLLIFCCDYGPDYEYAFTWGDLDGFRMPMPPGFLGC